MPQKHDMTEPPKWLNRLCDQASRAVMSDQSPIGCHYFYDPLQEAWEVSLFLAATEVVGGPQDGTRLPANFQLDIQHILNLFDDSPVIRWQVGFVAHDDMLGDHVSCEGTFLGHKVWLRILANSPTEVTPGTLLHANNGELEFVWQQSSF